MFIQLQTYQEQQDTSGCLELFTNLAKDLFLTFRVFHFRNGSGISPIRYQKCNENAPE